jgi:hypothetical protein
MGRVERVRDLYCEGMASLKIDPRSRYWYACITLPNGRQTQVSTKLRIKEVTRENSAVPRPPGRPNERGVRKLERESGA